MTGSMYEIAVAVKDFVKEISPEINVTLAQKMGEEAARTYNLWTVAPDSVCVYDRAIGLVKEWRQFFTGEKYQNIANKLEELSQKIQNVYEKRIGK